MTAAAWLATAGQLHVDAVVASGNRPFHHEHEFSRVVLDGGLQRGFRLSTGCCHQRLVVIERDHVKNQMGHVGRRGAQQRLGTSGAVLKMQPDD